MMPKNNVSQSDNIEKKDHDHILKLNAWIIVQICIYYPYERNAEMYIL